MNHLYSIKKHVKTLFLVLLFSLNGGVSWSQENETKEEESSSTLTEKVPGPDSPGPMGTEGSGGGFGNEYLQIFLNDEKFKDLLSDYERAMAVLEIQKNTARALVGNGDLSKAHEVLVNGLTEALKLIQQYPYSYTHYSIARGAVLNQVFQEYEKRDQDLNVVVSYLLSYYDLIKDITYRFDKDHYFKLLRVFSKDQQHPLPKIEKGAYDHFGKAYADFVRLYLKHALKAGTQLKRDCYETQIAEYITQWAFEDLNESLYRREFSKTITELVSLQSILSAYHQGQYPKNSKQMVIEVRGWYEYWVQSLEEWQPPYCSEDTEPECCHPCCPSMHSCGGEVEIQIQMIEDCDSSQKYRAPCESKKLKIEWKCSHSRK